MYNVQERRTAEAALNAWSKTVECVPALLNRSSQSAHVEVRQLASIVLKKKIPGKWRQLSPEVRSAMQTDFDVSCPYESCMLLDTFFTNALLSGILDAHVVRTRIVCINITIKLLSITLLSSPFTFSAQVQEATKTTLLESIVKEPVANVRRASADLMAVIARYTVPQGAVFSFLLLFSSYISFIL